MPWPRRAGRRRASISLSFSLTKEPTTSGVAYLLIIRPRLNSAWPMPLENISAKSTTAAVSPSTRMPWEYSTWSMASPTKVSME